MNDIPTFKSRAFDSAQFNDPLIVEAYDTVNPIDEYRDFYVELAESSDARIVIDIGCGTGLLTRELTRVADTVIGVEPSKSMLKIARKCESANIDWIKGVASDLQSYGADLALMTGHVAQFHLTDTEWNRALQGIKTALKPSGRFAFESRNPAVRFWLTGHGNTGWRSTKEAPHVVQIPRIGALRMWTEFLRYERDLLTYELHYEFVERKKKVVSTDTLRFRTRDEIESSLHNCGFAIENLYGSWDKRPVTENSPEFVFVAKRM